MARHLPHRGPELREGVAPAPFATASPDTILAMPIDILFDFAAVHVIGDKAADVDLRIDFDFTDLDETWTMWVRRGVLNARRGALAGRPAHRVRAEGGARRRPAATRAAQSAQLGRGRTDHPRRRRHRPGGVRGLLDEFDPNFRIVTP